MGGADDLSGQLQSIKTLFHDYLEEYGIGSASVGWRDEARHRLRFDRLAELVRPISDEPVTVADLGCGYGALFPYLLEQGLRIGRYVGYEVSPDMLAAARATVTDERAEFVESSEVAEPVDYSFACGTFFNKFEADDDVWDAYVKRSLRTLAERSRRGFAFNLLSTYVDFREPHLFYGDPKDYFDFCVREISRHVAVFHDYPPLWEWTMVVRTGPPHRG